MPHRSSVSRYLRVQVVKHNKWAPQKGAFSFMVYNMKIEEHMGGLIGTCIDETGEILIEFGEDVESLTNNMKRLIKAENNIMHVHIDVYHED